MRISRETLENQQIWIYAVSLIAGGIIGIVNEPFANLLEILISPFIATFAAAVIVTQTIVELIGELVYMKVVPNWIVKDVGFSI